VTPIFVGGSPRSGTTLLGSMLGAHDSVVCLPEAPFIGSLALALPRDGADRIAAEKVHRAIRGDFKFAFWNLGAEDLEACAEVTGGSYRELIEVYIASFARRNGRPGATRWVDHSPTNLMYSARLYAGFPDAKFIHLVRDGRAVCASWLPLNWGPNTIIPAARTWAMHVAHGLAAEAALPPPNIRRICYESLVSAPEGTLRELCEWLGLSYQQAMVTGSGFKVPAYTRSQHGLIGAPADPKRIDGWLTKLTGRELEIFEYVTGDLLVHLGYELKGSGYCAEPSSFEKLRMEFTERIRQFAHLTSRPIRLKRFLMDLHREQRKQDIEQ
jgi:sulfotransferase family protein